MMGEVARSLVAPVAENISNHRGRDLSSQFE
jgi:hypothetical protein